MKRNTKVRRKVSATYLLSAEDKATAGELKRRLIDRVLLVDILQRRLEGEDVFNQAGHVLRDAVIAGPQCRLNLLQHAVRYQVRVVASSWRDGRR